MKTAAALLVLALGAGSVSAAGPAPWTKAILLYPPQADSGRVGEPGQVVSYRTAAGGPAPARITLRVNGGETPGVPPDAVIPYDSLFSLSRVYLTVISERPAPAEENAYEELRDLYLAATNVLREFPSHPLAEEMLAQRCLLSYELDEWEDGSKTGYPRTKGLLDEWLARYPGGARRDELEWLRLQVENEPYEYEGAANFLLQVAGVYERYLALHPGSRLADEIRLDIARKLRMAHESGGDAGQAARLRARAEAAFEALLASRDPETRASAWVALYNLRHGRRSYNDPDGTRGDW